MAVIGCDCSILKHNLHTTYSAPVVTVYRKHALGYPKHTCFVSVRLQEKYSANAGSWAFGKKKPRQTIFLSFFLVHAYSVTFSILRFPKLVVPRFPKLVALPTENFMLERHGSDHVSSWSDVRKIVLWHFKSSCETCSAPIKFVLLKLVRWCVACKTLCDNKKTKKEKNLNKR